MKTSFIFYLVIFYSIHSTREECFYKGLECPEYELISENEEYQVRSYKPIVWATTSIENEEYEMASYVLFLRLFNYVTRHNENGQKINMTVPIRTLIPNVDDDNQTMEMSFYIPSSISENLPQPNDGNVTIRKEDASMYAVRCFSGYAIAQKTWEDEAKKLAGIVKNNTKIDTSYYYIAGYDSPMTFHDQRNEIWMTLKEK